MKALCLIALVLIATPARAENRLGAMAGLNFAKMRLANDTQAASSDGITGFVGGAFFQLGLNPDLYLEPQLRVIGKGGTVTTIENSDIRLTYLELPVYLKFKVPTGTALRPYVFAGPALGLKVSAKVAGLGGSAVSQNFKAFDLSADFGLGGELALNETAALNLTAAYSLSFLDTLDGALRARAGGVTFKNQGFQLTSGISFALE